MLVVEPQLPATGGTVSRVDERHWTVTAPSGAGRVELTLGAGPLFLLDGRDELFVLPSDAANGSLRGSGMCWVLPQSARDGDAWLIEADGAIAAERSDDGPAHQCVISARNRSKSPSFSTSPTAASKVLPWERKGFSSSRSKRGSVLARSLSH